VCLGLRPLLENLKSYKTPVKPPTESIRVVAEISHSEVYDVFNPFGAGIFFKILAHPVYKMRILQEPKKIAL
jgi:hypothetical protein